MALTVMPSAAHSTASPHVSATTAPFDALYEVRRTIPLRAEIDAMLMIRPLCFRRLKR
jgi:hypothetical protein